jgi:ATP-binding protein involved in chromosome partitioning
MSYFVCPHCGERIYFFGRGVGERVASAMGVPFLGSIPLDPAIAKDSDSGRPFVVDMEDSEAANAFRGIVAKIEAIRRDISRDFTSHGVSLPAR